MPSKRLAGEECETPLPRAKRPRQTPAKMPVMTGLSCATKEDLVAFVKQLCVDHPAIRDDVRAFVPDLPVDKMLTEIKKAAGQIEKKMPWDRYGRGNRDTYAYNRVRSFISSFAKLVTAHLKTVEKSGQTDKIGEFINSCHGLVDDMHEFADPSQNATKKRLQTALEKVGRKIGLEFDHSAEVESSEADISP
mmetsp:Transcript_67923/g.124920  ORF Transcript_67923/g.124920 Transcript_67923/m.124920 type:complete len:192 (+) Transcript_67923:103-678(+)